MYGRVQKKASFPLTVIFCLLTALCLPFASCSFNYGENPGLEKDKPDIVMEDIEYVRVRGGDPLVRFQAEYAERWEDRNVMELKNFSFEQFEDRGETINASGRAGTASVQLGPGNISLGGGVRISVDSEDITIRTAGLEWKDKEKLLSGGARDEVDIERSDGTSFSGRGFTADARSRTWTFLEEIRGTYVEKEDGEEEISDEETRADKDRVLAEGEDLRAQAPAAARPPDTESVLPGTEQPQTLPEQPKALPEEALPSFVEEK